MIVDERQVEKFVSMLPDLEEGECYILMLVCRYRFIKDKYNLKIRDTVLEQYVVRWGEGWRESMLRRIRRLALLGAHARELYTVRGVPVPPEACGILCVLNPARVKHALADLIADLVKTATIEQNWERVAKLPRVWLGHLHRRVKRRFHTIDVDTTDPELIGELESELRKYGGWFMKIQTRRGFHYVLDMTKIDVRRFFPEFVNKKLPELRKQWKDEEGNPLIEYQKTPLEPIPGTLYGGVVVRLCEE